MNCPLCGHFKTWFKIQKASDPCRVIRCRFCSKCLSSFTTVEAPKFDCDQCVEISELPVEHTCRITESVVERYRGWPGRIIVTQESVLVANK